MKHKFLEDFEDLLYRQKILYKYLHQHPELSMEEHQTANRIETELRKFDVEILRIGGSGVVAILRNGAGATVLTRADTDALPIAEKTGLDYESTVTGVMHACGHDMHIAALLGAVELLDKNKDSWSGTYIALFQPAEEIAAGAQLMLDDGLAEKIPQPDVALSQHVVPTEAGTIGTSAGPVLAAGDSIKITVFGRGGHGSMPHRAIDPVVLASSIVVRLQTIVAREIPPSEPAVVTVGAINAGRKSNILPDQAELLVNIRTFDPALRLRVIKAIERIVRSECQATGSLQEPHFHYYDHFPVTSNDRKVTTKITEAFVSFFGSECVYETDPYTISEDFSRIPDALGVPYTFWFVGTIPAELYRQAVERGTEAEEIPTNHSAYFAPAIDPTLKVSIQAHVIAALSYLSADANLPQMSTTIMANQ